MIALNTFRNATSFSSFGATLNVMSALQSTASFTQLTFDTNTDGGITNIRTIDVFQSSSNQGFTTEKTKADGKGITNDAGNTVAQGGGDDQGNFFNGQSQGGTTVIAGFTFSQTNSSFEFQDEDNLGPGTNSQTATFSTASAISQGNYQETSITAATRTISYATNVSTQTTFLSVSKFSVGTVATFRFQTKTVSTVAFSDRSSSLNGTNTEVFDLTKTINILGTSVIDKTSALKNPSENGLIIVTEFNDWVWSYNSSLLSTNLSSNFFLSQMASSIGSPTAIFGIWSTSKVNFVGVESSDKTKNFIVGGQTSQITYDYFTSLIELTTSSTSGDFFPRDTVATTFALFGVSSTSFSFGPAKSTLNGYGTHQFSITSIYYSSSVISATYLSDGSNSATATLRTTFSHISNGISTEVSPFYTSNFSSSTSAASADSDASSAFGVSFGLTSAYSQEQTNYFQIGFASYDNFGAISAFQRVAAKGAFVAPENLTVGTANFLSNFGGNLSFNGGSIYMPQSNLSGVFQNVNTPIISDVTLVDTSLSNTWLYNWSTSAGATPTLQYSKYGSYNTSGVSSSSLLSVSSGQFNTVSSVGTNFIDQQGNDDIRFPNVFGGYPALGHTVSIQGVPRAVYGTVIGVSSAPSSYSSIFNNFSTASAAGNLIAEESAVAWNPVLSPAIGGPQFTNYQRNPED